jgi:hypothetical protein
MMVDIGEVAYRFVAKILKLVQGIGGREGALGYGFEERLEGGGVKHIGDGRDTESKSRNLEQRRSLRAKYAEAAIAADTAPHAEVRSVRANGSSPPSLDHPLDRPTPLTQKLP